MLADFLGSYLVTIAGVVTTGAAALAARFGWRWATSPAPSLVRLRLLGNGFHVINSDDFTVHVVRVDQEGGWNVVYERPRRLPSGRYTVSQWDEAGAVFRVDRSYSVVLRNDAFARWKAYYSGRPGMDSVGGAAPSVVERIWPVALNVLLRQVSLSRALLRRQC